MRGNDDRLAPRDPPCERGGHPFGARLIEPVHRFVHQQYVRARLQGARGDRAFGLAGGQHPHRHLCQGVQTQLCQNPGCISGTASVHCAPETQCLFDARFRIEGAALIRQRDAACDVGPARGGFQQPGENAQQAGFSGTVRSGQQTQGAAFHPPVQAGKDQPLAAQAGKLLDADRRPCLTLLHRATYAWTHPHAKPER